MTLYLTACPCCPYLPHPGFVRGETCYMCGEPGCRESMPHGNHPDWLRFLEVNGPDPFGKLRASPQVW
jgi:hypothetical protein